MKILVTGSEGMLGREVCNRLKELRMSYRGMSHSELDITDSEKVAGILLRESPEILINCAGLVKELAIKEEETHLINSLAPVAMAERCDKLNIRMVHISTDCVFKGDKPCYEFDIPGANDLYGLSKTFGEVFYGNHLTIRCSFIGFGPRGLLNWLMNQKGEVPGYAKVKWNGMTTRYAARSIIDLAISERTWKIHIFGKDTTKYHVLKTANKVLGLGLKVKQVDEPVMDRRLRTITDYSGESLTTLEEQLKEMVNADCGNPGGAE